MAPPTCTLTAHDHRGNLLYCRDSTLSIVTLVNFAPTVARQRSLTTCSFDRLHGMAIRWFVADRDVTTHSLERSFLAASGIQPVGLTSIRGSTPSGEQQRLSRTDLEMTGIEATTRFGISRGIKAARHDG